MSKLSRIHPMKRLISYSSMLMNKLESWKLGYSSDKKPYLKFRHLVIINNGYLSKSWTKRLNL